MSGIFDKWEDVLAHKDLPIAGVFEFSPPAAQPVPAPEETETTSLGRKIIFRRRWIIFTFCTFILCSYLFSVSLIKIPTSSMSPVINCGDHLLMQTFFKNPSQGDFVVFHPPKNYLHTTTPIDSDAAFAAARTKPLLSNNLWIKTIVAKEGEAVKVSNGKIYLNNHERSLGGLHGQGPDWGPAIVPANHYFVLGENMSYSLDSRYFGFLPRSAIVGTAVARVWPNPGRISPHLSSNSSCGEK